MADEEEEFFSYFPDDFKEYMYKELNWLPKFNETFLAAYVNGVVFWSREDDEPERLSFTLPDSNISNLNKIIRDLLSRITYHWAAFATLVQFWAPITTKEGRSFLTTRNQPFSLMSYYDRHGIEGLCGYRMICMDSKFDIDLDGGKTCEQHLPARVFNHQFPESTPNVEFYSITECVGVIEVVTPEEDLGLLICSSYCRYDIYIDFEKFGLKCSVVSYHKDMELDDDKNEAHKVAFDEIKNVLKRVCDVHDVPFAQAWVPCKMSWLCRALVDGGILHASCYYKKDDYDYDEDEDEDDYGEDVDAFRHISSLFHLKNGVGVVGRALLSTNMVFCRDVTQLSLSEYPLAHYARKARLSGCFAICLESNYTGNDVYVLEVFMPMSNNASENPHTSLRKILETMRKNFQISIQNGEKLDPVQIPQTTISLPQLELSQSEVEVMQVHSSDQQLVNAINTGSNVFGTKHNNLAITCTQEKDTVRASKRKGNKSGGTVKASTRKGDKSGATIKSSDREDNKKGVKIEISLEEILQTSEMKLEDAAQSLGVSKSTLKRVCRVYLIKRWPPRKKNKVVCSQLNESDPCVDLEQSSQLNLDDLPFAQPSATIVHTEPHDTTMQDANVVTIKAKYAEELQQEVAQRLNLEVGTYCVKYKDPKKVMISHTKGRQRTQHKHRQ
ncbi:hypothetical protein ACSBR1_011365 [Camellia fascicularis]